LILKIDGIFFVNTHVPFLDTFSHLTLLFETLVSKQKESPIFVVVGDMNAETVKLRKVMNEISCIKQFIIPKMPLYTRKGIDSKKKTIFQTIDHFIMPPPSSGIEFSNPFIYLDEQQDLSDHFCIGISISKK